MTVYNHKQVAKQLAKESALTFFKREYHKKYPEFEELAAENLAKNKPKYFFVHKLHRKYPEFLLLMAK